MFVREGRPKRGFAGSRFRAALAALARCSGGGGRVARGRGGKGGAGNFDGRRGRW